MGANDSADNDGEKKDTPVVKQEKGAGQQRNRPRYYNNRNQGNRIPKKKDFTGACASLSGHVFEAGNNRMIQMADHAATHEAIKNYIGVTYDPHVLKSIETDALDMPPQPTLVTAGATATRSEELIFNKKVDRWLARCEKIELELKQVFSLYLGQCDEDIKAALTESPAWRQSNEDKDVLRLVRIINSVTFNYKSGQEPFLTMFLTMKELT